MPLTTPSEPAGLPAFGIPDSGKRRIWRLSRIRTRLLVAFCSVALVTAVAAEAIGLFGLPWLDLPGTLQEQRSRALRSLNELADAKRNLLQGWLGERRQDSLALAESEALGPTVCRLADHVGRAGADGEIDPAYWRRYRQHPDLALVAAELRSLRDSAAHAYTAIGFREAQFSYVIASSRDEAVGSSLSGQEFFERARAPGQLETIDILRSPVDGRRHLVLSQQVFRRDDAGNKSELCAITMHLVRMDSIPLTEGSAGGLTQTGEIILINHDQRIMTPLRHALPGGGSAAVNEYRLDSGPAALATSGGEGMTTNVDYRGVTVLTAYRHVRVSPDLGWGIIVKLDETEALAPVYESLRQRLTLAGLSLLATVLIVIVVSHRLSAPITVLAKTARALESGNLSARSGLAGDDEIGRLARTFDAMAHRFQQWHEVLNQEVQRRTLQVERLNQLYRTLSETNQAIVRIRDRETLFFEVCRIAVDYGRFEGAWIMSGSAGQMTRESCWTGPGVPCWNQAHPERIVCPSEGLCQVRQHALVIDDTATDERVANCRNFLLKANWRAIATFPLTAEETVFGVFAVASAEANIFGPQEMALLGEMASDIGFAVQSFERESRRMAAEAAVRAQEAQLNAITSAALDAVICVDGRGAIAFWNPAATKLFGYSVDEALGSPLHRLLAPPERRGTADGGFRHFVDRGSGPFVGRTVEIVGRHKDGHDLPIELSISAVGQRQTWQAVGIARDITERKKSEEALRMVAEELSVQSGSGFFQAAAQGLARLLEADLVMIAELMEGGDAIAAVGLAPPSGVPHSVTYGLAGSPCAEVISAGVRVHRSDVARLFPADRLLDGTDAFAGVRVEDVEGRPIGIIAVLWRRPLPDAAQPESIIRIFAARAGAELARARADAQLQESEQARRILAYAVEQSPTSVIITDPTGNIEYVNANFVETTGYALDECVGKTPRFLNYDPAASDLERGLRQAIREGKVWHGEICNRKRSGEPFWVSTFIAPLRDPDGNINHFVELAEDITLRKDYEARLVHQAHYDELTGLPNRLLAIDRLMREIAGAERRSKRVGLMFIDLDNFKQVNDTLGHAVGDALLRQAAERLSASVRRSDTVSRLGGDEFLVILGDVGDVADVERVADSILTAFRTHFVVEGHEIYSTASIGMTISPDDGDTVGALMRNADAAMYHAKADGRNTHRFFSTDIAHRSQRRMSVETRLRRAIERGEFYPVYQPIVDIRSDRPIGAEVLLRWNSKELGAVYPDEFIPIAEDTGMIVPIGEHVLMLACAEAAAWDAHHGDPLRLAVNVSARQIRAGNFTAMVERILAANNLAPSRLEIEITERAVIDNLDQATRVLNELREMGIRVSMDDFGTGYSSLSYLHDLPIDTLKIDKSFVSNILRDPRDAGLSAAIIAIGRSIDLDVLAEGVEETGQLDFLRRHGCDLAQGYLFSKPVPATAFRQLISRRNAAGENSLNWEGG